MPSSFHQHASRRILVIDGAMGTSIYAHNPPLSVEKDYCGCENCTDILVRSRPDVIQQIHESFLAVGADAVETDTFGSNKLVLGEFGLTAETRSLNKMAAELARAACAKFTTSDKPRFVLGSMGPGTKLVTLGNTHWDEMFDSYREQARGLLDGGVDAFIIETCQDLLQVKCAIDAVLEALKERNKDTRDVPIMVSVTIETTGTMLLGTSIEGAVTALSGFPIMSLGLNCATGPAEMTEHVHYLGKHWGVGGYSGEARAVSVIPNAGLPALVNGKTEYPLGPVPFAEAMLRFVRQDGVGIVGGCCGTTPEHIAQLVKALESGGLSAPVKVDMRAPKPGVTSLYAPTDYRQDNSLLIIGERMNSSGSRKFKQLLEAEDWDGIVSLAREQVRHDSAHVLDVNVDYAGRDNAKDMAEVVKRVVRQVDAPLMLDSTQLATIEAGLKHAPGKCIINSGNFEDGEHKFDQICQMAKAYGAALVIGSIDEDKEASMARTADRKLAIAQRAFDRATRVHGMAPADLMFDPLVLPISTGMESDRRSALETIEGVRRISAAMPECQTTVGLSNVSFGLKPAARTVLNSVFLHELREAGLTSAILHFSKILPRNKIPQEQWDAAIELVYDRRSPGVDPLSKFIELFKDVEGGAAVKKEMKLLSLEEQLAAHIVDGEKEGLTATLDTALKKYKPLDIINDHLLGGMKTVGELFGSGQMQLPFVLQSAEVMKMAVSYLEPLMEKLEGGTKGKIVLATVKGDVHDIGKNLVDIILSNNGYTVFNIGIKQPIAEIVKAAKEHKADAIGMSGLLVKSVNVMEENLAELNALSIDTPVLLGGAALTRHYCEGHLRSGYKGKVFYGKDAFEGLRTMDCLMAGQTATLDSEISERLQKRTAAEEVVARSRAESGKRMEAFETAKREGGVGVLEEGTGRRHGATQEKSEVRTDVSVPRAPFWGSRVAEGIDLEQVYPFINKVALYRGQWQFKQGAMSDDDFEAQLEDTVGPIFTRLKERCAAETILAPAVVYGYFPCNSEGNDLIVYDADDHAREIERFSFPRQASRKRLCISDYFKDVTTGVKDVLALTCVTVGKRATEAAQELYKANNYSEYLYLHGMGVETAEGLAEMWHKRVRQELGIGNEDAPRVKDLFTQKYRGSRYSFGYPACPDMSDQEKLFRLLKPERIGCVLTENWQIDPEQSTSAIVVHHPEAKYFNV
ncbi:MAG: methionine synthase [Phycisphaerales bacterium]|nr:methionine synthase [Phycisphaerales bacterium]